MVARQSFYVDAPVGTVFDYFKDPELSRDIALYDLDEVKATKDGVGTFYTWSFKVAGVRFGGLEVLTDVVPDKHITERSSIALAGRWEYDFEPEGSGTRLTVTIHPRSFWQFPPLDTLVDLAFPRVSQAVMPRYIKAIEEAAKRKPKVVPSKPRKTAASR
jgi:hypothetical protein